jgi:hypothetical protein
MTPFKNNISHVLSPTNHRMPNKQMLQTTFFISTNFGSEGTIVSPMLFHIFIRHSIYLCILWSKLYETYFISEAQLFFSLSISVLRQPLVSSTRSS